MPKYLDGAGLSHFWESIKPKLGGVTKSGSGTVVSSDDAANLPPLSLTIHGKSVQDGTPSPSSPVAIESVEPTSGTSISLVLSDGTTTPIDLQGNALRSLPDGTEDTLEVDGEGNKTLTKRMGEVTFDGSEGFTWTVINTANSSLKAFLIRATGGSAKNWSSVFGESTLPIQSADVAKRANVLANRLQPSAQHYNTWTSPQVTMWGDASAAIIIAIDESVTTSAQVNTWLASNPLTVVYELNTPQTISLGKIDLPSLPSPSFSMHVDALVTPTLDAEWFTEGGGKVIDAVSTRITALESEVDALQADVTELQGQVPEMEVLYDTSTWTIAKYGRTVMVQVHGATATPSTSTALITGILADYKPAYNCSATVLTSSGSSTQAARMAVYADTGNVYIVPAGYSSSASWYGTLTYIY